LHLTSPLFPYPTLFRSPRRQDRVRDRLDPGRSRGALGAPVFHVVGDVAGVGGLLLKIGPDDHLIIQTLREEPRRDELIVRPGRLDRKSTRLNSSHVAIS